jgi:hypothetical protein
MKVSIMQPYIFPYIGYFQLIYATDLFVIHDDVQWIKCGWINRNRFLVNGKDQIFTFSVKKDSNYKNINERIFADIFNEDVKKFDRIIYNAYHKTPYYDSVRGLLDNIFHEPPINVSDFAVKSISAICQYLQIGTPILISSKLTKDNSLAGQARVLNINKCVGSTHYINPSGGTELYSKEEFEKNNIKLNFLKTRNIPYTQFNDEFIPFLSIIDVV